MIDHIPSRHLYVTTNIYNEHSNGKAFRNHRLMTLLGKQGILKDKGNINLYYTNQNLWKLDIDEYLKRRERIKGKYVA